MEVLAILVPGYLRAGQVHMPLYGFFAAAGLLAAVWITQQTGLTAGLSAPRLWDAGIFAIVAAFVISRVLLVIADFSTFRHYPWLILTLPSLTLGGLLVTAVFTWLWLQWKRLPVFDVMDAWAPSGALLWSALSLGHFVEGTNAGMPTDLPWGVVTSGDTVLGHTHPVQLYTCAVALALCFLLLWQLPRRRYAGSVAALGLFLGGIASFLLGMLQQPTDTWGDSWLDPGQWTSLLAILGGLLLVSPLVPTPEVTRLRVADFLEKFVLCRGRMRMAWMKRSVFTDPMLVEIQERFLRLPREFPPISNDSPWCESEGLEILTWYVHQLRGRDAAKRSN